MNGARSIAVLGGGITGLTAAYRLGQLGHRVRLFEQSARLGGAIRTECHDGWLVEAGPNSFQAGDPAVAELLEDLGVRDEIVEPSALAKNRFIVRGDKLVPVPSSPGGLLGSPLFSAGAKFRILREFFLKASGTEGSAADVSVADFTRRHFGDEVLACVVQPFISGIYAGDAEALSTRHAFPKLWAMEQAHGSILRGQIAAAKANRARGGSGVPKIISFRRGLQTLPHAIAAKMNGGVYSLGAQIDRIVHGKPWQIHWRTDEHAPVQVENFDAVVSALPAAGLSRLTIGTAGEKPLASLGGISHPPLSSLFLGFKREQIAHPLDGFGALVPATERRSILGMIFSSSLFPDRAPSGHVAITVFVGGTLQPQLAALPEAELLARVMSDVRSLLGANGDPVFIRRTLWPAAIPQYVLGYEKHLAAMTACEQANPGLFIGGQVRDGISLPNCVAAGEKLAARSVS